MLTHKINHHNTEDIKEKADKSDYRYKSDSSPALTGLAF
jgi:hypothetical protein